MPHRNVAGRRDPKPRPLRDPDPATPTQRGTRMSTGSMPSGGTGGSKPTSNPPSGERQPLRRLIGGAANGTPRSRTRMK